MYALYYNRTRLKEWKIFIKMHILDLDRVILLRFYKGQGLTKKGGIKGFYRGV